jgi:hypothetical protein
MCSLPSAIGAESPILRVGSSDTGLATWDRGDPDHNAFHNDFAKPIAQNLRQSFLLAQAGDAHVQLRVGIHV